MTTDSYGREAIECKNQVAAQAAYEKWDRCSRQIRGWSSPAVWAENEEVYHGVVAHGSDLSAAGMLQEIIEVGGKYYAVKW